MNLVPFLGGLLPCIAECQFIHRHNLGVVEFFATSLSDIFIGMQHMFTNPVDLLLTHQYKNGLQSSFMPFLYGKRVRTGQNDNIILISRQPGLRSTADAP